MIRVNSNLFELLVGTFPETTVVELLQTVSLNPAIAEEFGRNCSRAVIAQALNLGLLADLLARAPSARTYLDGLKEQSRRLVFDHGALRTVGLAGMGSLPAGEQAIARVLQPLGYLRAEHYPLDRLKMTGWSYRHRDFPEDLPQFFVSELHVERFSPEFQEAAARVTLSSDDPLTDAHRTVLNTLDRDHHLELDDAVQLLGPLIACFTRRHQPPVLADYEMLLAESAEMAWIATEGNAFNHATDRVSDVEALAQAQRDLGRRMKDKVEVSSSRRVRQTAYRADPILRPFIDAVGEETLREVPGSFFEFIQRDMMPDTSRLDLSFDTGNAQGIFKMTAAQAA